MENNIRCEACGEEQYWEEKYVSGLREAKQEGRFSSTWKCYSYGCEKILSAREFTILEDEKKEKEKNMEQKKKSGIQVKLRLFSEVTEYLIKIKPGSDFGVPHARRAKEEAAFLDEVPIPHEFYASHIDCLADIQDFPVQIQEKIVEAFSTSLQKDVTVVGEFPLNAFTKRIMRIDYSKEKFSWDYDVDRKGIFLEWLSNGAPEKWTPGEKKKEDELQGMLLEDFAKKVTEDIKMLYEDQEELDSSLSSLREEMYGTALSDDFPKTVYDLEEFATNTVNERIMDCIEGNIEEISESVMGREEFSSALKEAIKAASEDIVQEISGAIDVEDIVRNTIDQLDVVSEEECNHICAKHFADVYRFICDSKDEAKNWPDAARTHAERVMTECGKARGDINVVTKACRAIVEEANLKAENAKSIAESAMEKAKSANRHATISFDSQNCAAEMMAELRKRIQKLEEQVLALTNASMGNKERIDLETQSRVMSHEEKHKDNPEKTSFLFGYIKKKKES